MKVKVEFAFRKWSDGRYTCTATVVEGEHLGATGSGVGFNQKEAREAALQDLKLSMERYTVTEEVEL